MGMFKIPPWLSRTLQTVDDNTPSFNEWNECDGRLLSVHGFSADDSENNDDQPIEDPPTLSESLEFVRRLRRLSTTQQPELHPFVIQLQSKLTDVLLDSNISKQKSICDYFKPISVVSTKDPIVPEIFFYTNWIIYMHYLVVNKLHLINKGLFHVYKLKTELLH